MYNTKHSSFVLFSLSLNVFKLYQSLFLETFTETTPPLVICSF